MPLDPSYMLNEPSVGPLASQTTVGASTLTRAETASGVQIKTISVEEVTVPLTASSVSQTIFIADDNYQLVSVKAVPNVKGGAGATVTVEALTGTQAPGAGVAQLSAALVIGSTATNDTVLNGVLIAAPTVISAGQRFGIVMAGTLTALVGLLTVVVKRV